MRGPVGCGKQSGPFSYRVECKAMKLWSFEGFSRGEVRQSSLHVFRGLEAGLRRLVSWTCCWQVLTLSGFMTLE